MDVALTGTPGVGKTAVANVLASRGYSVLSVKDIALESRCCSESSGELEVDVPCLARWLSHNSIQLKESSAKEESFIDGHLSHLLPVDMIIVLRLSPKEVRRRLLERDYSNEKLEENVEAEVVGVCLSEAVETDVPVAEVDCTGMSIDELAGVIENIVRHKDHAPGIHVPGNVDWLEGAPWG